MTTYTRKNAWNDGGTFSNSDLLWYAKAVQKMMEKSLDDENSWWFFAAIHGEYITQNVPDFVKWSTVPAPTAVPTSPLPSSSVMNKYWNQCQHQSWFFPPWHRGYLIALEAQVRAEVINLGGPENWALPYWNYFGSGDQYKIPPAFTKKQLPDGEPNPLYVTARYGPNNNGVIYVDTSKVNQKCQGNTIYTGSNSNTTAPGYGGPVTGFHHNNGDSGNLESNPHNGVHTQVGGSTSVHAGLMSYPGTAGLDPIFYLHHCNIDRMWAAWNGKGNSNPSDNNWLEGPAAIGEREFSMPMPDGSSWNFTPQDVDDMSKVDYDYEDLTTIPAVPNTLAIRLNKLGAGSPELLTEKIMAQGKNSELIGANDGSLKLDGAGLNTTVKLDRSLRKNITEKLMRASVSNIPDKVYLEIKNVTGKVDANMLTVSVNGHVAGHISLFGLMGASLKDGHHGGSGMNFTLDITDIVDDLHLNNALDADELDVSIFPGNMPDDESITVGRINVFREEQG